MIWRVARVNSLDIKTTRPTVLQCQGPLSTRLCGIGILKGQKKTLLEDLKLDFQIKVPQYPPYKLIIYSFYFFKTPS